MFREIPVLKFTGLNAPQRATILIFALCGYTSDQRRPGCGGADVDFRLPAARLLIYRNNSGAEGVDSVICHNCHSTSPKACTCHAST